MTRKFQTSEKQSIQQALMDKGRQLFARNGLKRTSIAELTHAAGIGQGSFYLFYDSKEELYFDVLEREERVIGQAIQDLLLTRNLTRQRLKQVLAEGLALLLKNDLIRNMLENNEYQQIIRKLPEDRFQGHLTAENRLIAEAVKQFQKTGRLKNIKPAVLRGLLHALFLMHLHRNEIGPVVFPDLLQFLLDAAADELGTTGPRNGSVAGAAYLE
ncbi:MAG: TetR/AcrR family transcriptional regulator [Proteobacteria bacterium]|nr:TetR/AcrR family transcriptional regulator [Pseudomonadota bacterium]